MQIAPALSETVSAALSGLAPAAARTGTGAAQQQAASPASGQPQASVWRDVGQRYNVRSMTLEDMDAMTGELYQAGAITLLDRAVLSLDPTHLEVDGQPLSEDAIRLTRADAQGRRDWLAEYQAQRADALARGDAQSAAMDERMLDILGRVAAGSGPGLSLSV